MIADVIDMTGIRILRVSTSFYGFFLLAILLYQNILVSAKKRLGLLDNDYEVSSRTEDDYCIFHAGSEATSACQLPIKNVS